MTLFRPRYKVRVNYKSGISEDFWCFKFDINNGGDSFKWESCKVRRPLLLGVDNIESVYVLREKNWWLF